MQLSVPPGLLLIYKTFSIKENLKCTIVQALRVCTGRTAHRGSRGIALFFLDHGTRSEGSVSRPDRSLHPGKTRYPLYRRLGGPQGRDGQVRKISSPPGFDPRTVQLAASRYTDWATGPTFSDCQQCKSTYIFLWPIYLSDFSQISSFSTDFWFKVADNQIGQKFLHWTPLWWIWADRHTDGRTDIIQLVDAFCCLLESI